MKYLPNLITCLRILIIPWIPYVYKTLDSPSLALALVVFAAFTDFLDGFLARRFKATSIVGQALDPLADKLFLIVILHTLFSAQNLPAWLFYAYIALELFFILISAFLWFYEKDLIVKAGPFGKVATALFFLFSVLSFTSIPKHYLLPGFYLIFFIKVLAMINYGTQILQEISRKKKLHYKSKKDPDS